MGRIEFFSHKNVPHVMRTIDILPYCFLCSQDCYVVERNARNSTLSHDCRVVRMVKVLVTNSKPVKFKLDGLVPSDGKCSLKVQRLRLMKLCNIIIPT